MNYFFFQIMLPGGKLLRGVAALPIFEIVAASNWLESRHAGIVVSLYRLPRLLGWILRWLQVVKQPKVRPKDVAGFLRDLAVMSASGIPIFDAIAGATEDQTLRANRAIRMLGRALLDDLAAGTSVSAAFARQSQAFPESVRSLIVIGDETGSMDRMLMEASDHIERVIGMRANAKQALIYPAFVFAAIFGAAGFWIYYVVPNLIGLFQQMNVPLPVLTVMVLAGAKWLTQHTALIVSLAVIATVASIVSWRYIPVVRRTVYVVLHRVPLSRTILASAGLAFFSEYLSILIHAGVGIVESLHILERTIRDTFYKDRIIAMRQYVERGDRVSTAMRQVGGFPAMMIRMISVGENTGTLDRQLSHLAREYRTRMARVIATLSEIIRPLVIVVAGAVFIVVIMALLLPVYDLVRQAMVTRN